MPPPSSAWLLRQVNRAPLVMILLLAAYVRRAHPELSWFGIDQARDAYTALGIVSGRSFPLMGVEVAGGPAHTWGPAYFYLIAIPFAGSRDPAFAVAVLSAAGVAGIFLTYRFGLGSRARDLLEDQGYFFEWITFAAPPRIAPPSSSLHYAIVRDEAG